jgi:endonuclease I
MRGLLITLSFCPLFIFAQVAKPNASQINFGNVFEGTTDSVQITIQNNEPRSLTITGFKFYTIYNETPFFVKQNNFTIPFQGSQSVWVYFSPKQNILHNSEMIIQHNGTSGYEPVDLIGQGKFSNTYYNSTENLSEEALKTALKTKTGQGYQSQSYNVARDNMYATIDNNGGIVECAYTGRTATFNSRTGANNNSFNCEHTFPQGHFSQSLPMRSDIHHLFSTDVTANSRRGNNPFGIVTNSTWSVGGSKASSTTFEPRDAQKGKTARALMYFVIRYQDYQSHFASQQTILKQWHNTFPVDAAERTRNNDIEAVQNNRNPFVDYPQFEKRITNFIANSVATQSFGLDVLQSSINFGGIIRAQADTFDYVLVNRGNRDIQFSNISLSNTSDFSFAGNSGSNSTLTPGEAIQISIIANTATTGSITGNLTFSTNIPGGQSSFIIPITATSIVVSLDELIIEDQINTFPNPVEDRLFIQYEGNKKLNIRLIDAVGKEIAISFLNSKQSIIDTKDLKSGIYFLEFSNGTEKTVKKLVK